MTDDSEAPPSGADPQAPPSGAEDCAEALKQRFPALFGGAPKPIKLRIQADIQAAAPGVFTRSALSAFLRRHTGRTAYLVALARGGPRFGLDGEPSGEVSDEHRRAAVDEIERRRTQRQAREQELEQQRRDRAALLRAFEATTLSRANFCALKGVPPDALDALLELARREAAERRAVADDPRRRPGAWLGDPRGPRVPRDPRDPRGPADRRAAPPRGKPRRDAAPPRPR
jgi:sRNA-binding protein